MLSEVLQQATKRFGAAEAMTICKPLYFLEVDIVFPDVMITELDGVPRRLVMPLVYGRADLLRDGNVARSTDAPIKAGVSHVFKIPERYRKGLETRLVSGSVTASAVERVGILVYALSFGDGSGFRAPGVPFSSTKHSRGSLPSPLALKLLGFLNRAPRAYAKSSSVAREMAPVRSVRFTMLLSPPQAPIQLIQRNTDVVHRSRTAGIMKKF